MFKPEELGKRLKEERERLDLTQKQVTDELGFNNYQSLLEIESGKREVKAWELAKLARIYQRDFSYFLKEEVSPSQPQPCIIWRAQSAKNPLIEQSFLHYIENYEKLERMAGIKREKLKPIKWDDEEKESFINDSWKMTEGLASEWSDKLKLGRRPAYLLTKILEESLAIKLFFWDIGPVGSAASTISETYGPAILINSADVPGRRNYDIAHEFFHLITWNIFPANSVNKRIEDLAEAFASAFLLPAEEVKTEFDKRLTDKGISLFDLVELAREFDVSNIAFIWRLVNLKLIEESTAKKILNEGVLKEIDRQRKNEINGKRKKPRLSDRFVALAIKAFQMGRISKGKLAEYLEIPFSNVTSFLLEHGYDENKDYSNEFTAT